jgi:hypothetical protein
MEILFLWAGLLFAWIGIVIVKSAMVDFAEAERVDGELIGYHANVDSEGSRTFSPVIAFQHPTGGRRIFQSEIGTGHFPYPVGQRVRVLAIRNDPERARLDSNGLLYFGLIFAAIGLGSCGLFFAIFSWGLFSIGSAIVVTLLLAWKALQKQDSLGKFAEASGLIRRALAGQAFEEAHYDRSRLMHSTEIALDQRRVAKASIIASVVMIAIGIGGIVGSAWWAPRRVSFIQHAVGTQGQVVDLVQSQDSDSTTWAPMVEFKPASSANAVRFRHSVSSSHPSWRVGDAVEVLYDPENTSQAMIDQGRWNMAVPLIPGAIGVVFALLGIHALIRISRG